MTTVDPTLRAPGQAAREWIRLGLAAAIAGGLAWVAAQLGAKGLVAATGGLALLTAAVLLRGSQRHLLGLFGLAAAGAVVLHKSFGPEVADISSGPISVYLTSVDVILVGLFGLWLLEGTLTRDLLAALRRPLVWVPIVAALLTTFSAVAAPRLSLVAAEVVRMAWMWLLFVFVGFRVRSRRAVWAVLAGMGALALVEFVVVLLQWRTGGVLGLGFLGVPTELGERTLDEGQLGRPFGTVIHPVFLGAVVGTLGLVALSLAIHLRTRRWRLVSLAVVPLAVAPLVISHIRAASVAFAVAAVALVLWGAARGALRWRTVALGALAGLVAVAASYPLWRSQFVDNFGTAHFLLEVESRLELNRVGMAMFLDHPVVGVGLNNFEQVVDRYDLGLIFGQNPVHNLFLLQLAETGVVGFVAMLLLAGALAVVAVRLARSSDPLFAGVGAAFAAVLLFFLLEEQLGFSLRQDQPRVLFWLLAGLAVACTRLAGLDPAPTVPTPPDPSGGAPTAGRARRSRRRARSVALRRGLRSRSSGERRHGRTWRRRRRHAWSAAIAATLVAGGVGGTVGVATEPHPHADMRLVFAAFDRDNGHQAIYTADGDGTDLARLVPLGEGWQYSWPVWAFGGSKILFTARQGRPGAPENIYLADADGSDVVALTNNDWRNAQPKLSPDGRWVLFTSMWDEFPEVALYRLDLDTLEVRNLSADNTPLGGFESDPKFSRDPRFSTDGERIIFARSVEDGVGTVPTQIWVMRPDGTDRKRLTRDAFYNTDPSLSRDGRYAAWASYRGEGHPGVPTEDNPFQVSLADWFLVVQGVDGGPEQVLTAGEACYRRPVADPCSPTEGPAYMPVWHPDGRDLAYLSIRSARHVCICVVDRETGLGDVLFERPDLAITWFDWVRPGASPADPAVIGSRVASEALLFGGRTRSDEAVLSISTQDRWASRPLALPDGLIATGARWSADRRYVLVTAEVAPVDPYEGQPHPAPPPGERRQEHFTLDMLEEHLRPPVERPRVARQQVFIYDAVDDELRQISDPWLEDHMDAIREGDARGNLDADLSPDGRFLVFTNVSATSNESFLLRYDLETGAVYSLTNATSGAMPVADAHPRYRPDGQRIAFSSSLGDYSSILTMRASDGRDVRTVVDDGFINLAPAWSPDGTRIAYVSYRGDEPLALEDDTATEDAVEGDIPLHDWYLVVADARTGAQRLLTVPGDPPAFRPAWSPDGRRIAFISITLPGQPDIYVVEADGSGRARPLQVTMQTHELFVDWR